MLRDAVNINAEALFERAPALEDAQDALVFENTIACDQLLEFVQTTLIDAPRIDVLPAAMFESSQKPLRNAFRLFDIQLATVTVQT